MATKESNDDKSLKDTFDEPPYSGPSGWRKLRMQIVRRVEPKGLAGAMVRLQVTKAHAEEEDPDKPLPSNVKEIIRSMRRMSGQMPPALKTATQTSATADGSGTTIEKTEEEKAADNERARESQLGDEMFRAWTLHHLEPF